MRTFRTTLLVAAAAMALVPSLAQAQPAPDNGQHHDGDGRGDRGNPPPPQAGAPSAPPTGGRPDAGRPPQGPRGFGGGDGGPGRWGPNAPGGQGGYAGRGDPRGPGGGQPDRPNQLPPGNPAGFGGRDGGRPDRDGGRDHGGRPDRGPGWDRGPDGGARPDGGPRPDRGPGWNRGPDQNGRQGPGSGWNRGRDGGRGWAGRDASRSGWHEWRGDRRYDWRGWREQHRQFYSLPRYYPPRGFGAGYRVYAPGYRIEPFFYDRAYWISDPYSYRLPPADGPYRWIRYYNDVLLVDLTTGEVVDVIHHFFE